MRCDGQAYGARVVTRLLRCAACAWALCAAQPSRAQTDDRPTATDPADTLAEDSYHEAFEALARGDRAGAERLLQALISAAPDHPLAARARSLLSTLVHEQPRVETGSEREAPLAPAESRPRTTGAARAELVFFQSIHGIALGAEVCAIARCNQAQPWVGALMLGAGAGFGASFGLTQHGVTPGFSRALTDGTWWGAANGLGLLLATGALDNNSHEGATTGAFLALGQITGLGLAAWAALELRPSAGQVSLTASGGLWSVVAGAELLAAFKPKFGERTWAGLLLGIGNAGVLAGGLLARAEPMPASRVLLIDAGGVLGSLTGLGIAVLAQGRSADPTPTFAVGLVGTLGGLGLAYYLTKDWDGGDSEGGAHASLGLMPLPGGAIAALHGWF